MSYDMVKFERGQVWKITFKNREHVGHEQAKDRPWLVLSISKYNHSSGMITAVPITSRDRVVSPAQVLFTNDNNMKNVIMCEGIRSFDTRSGNYVFEYMGFLSDEVMRTVDCSLSVHLGMNFSSVTMDKLYESMESIIKSSKYIQELSKAPKFTDDDVLNFAEKLQSLADSAVSNSRSVNEETPTFNVKNIVPEKKEDTPREEPKKAPRPHFKPTHQPTHQPLNPVIPSNFDKIIEANKNNDIGTKPVEKIDEVPTQEIKSARNKWTKKTCEEFLKDIDELPMKEVMSKWGIPKKQRVYTTKHYIKGLLENGKVF